MNRCKPYVLAFGVFFAGCQSQEGQPTSGTKQLVEDSFVCPAHTARLQGLQGRYPSTFQGGTESHLADAWTVMTQVPNEYLHWNFDNNNLPIELREVDGGVRGATTSQGNGDEWRPVSIWVGQKTGNFDPLLHELGHASAHYISKAFTDFEGQLESHYNWVLGQDESNYMRDYAKSDSTEMFAEIFDSFYCGQESRDFMAEHMPRTLAFAQRYLVDPTKLEVGSTGVDSIHGAELDLDSDFDGVSGANDLCPDTPHGETASFGRNDYGCSDSQSPQP